ncbi:hypothetical protein BC830DRAFT_1109957 [Chytriomyces sp. MP71]|nr:hypothetical protein BC830DRAFT_1109957 [Chytriomyces sp. MP71]
MTAALTLLLCVALSGHALPTPASVSSPPPSTTSLQLPLAAVAALCVVAAAVGTVTLLGKQRSRIFRVDVREAAFVPPTMAYAHEGVPDSVVVTFGETVEDLYRQVQSEADLVQPAMVPLEKQPEI